MADCKSSTNLAMGDASKFVRRAGTETYPSPILTMISPERGADEVAGASPFTVTMQVAVGIIQAADPDFGYDWGNVTGWCISWGDGGTSNGVFGSPVADTDGFLYALATATHTYNNTDDPSASHYFSDGFRPWATVTDTAGNAVATDFGSYIYVCRSDTVPDKIGGCGYPAETPPVFQPPTTVCTTGDVMCIGTAGFKCVGGAWSFDPYQETVCRNTYDPTITVPACTESNLECRDGVWYKCNNGQFRAIGTSCGDIPGVEPCTGGHTCDQGCPNANVPPCLITESECWGNPCSNPECPGYSQLCHTDSGTSGGISGGTIFGLSPQTLAIVGVALVGGIVVFGGKK